MWNQLQAEHAIKKLTEAKSVAEREKDILKHELVSVSSAAASIFVIIIVVLEGLLKVKKFESSLQPTCLGCHRNF